MRTKGESLSCQSWWKVILCGSILLQAGAAVALSQALVQPQNRIALSCCPAASLAQSRCQQWAPLLSCSLVLLLPVTGAGELTGFLRLGCPASPALPPWPRTPNLPALHTAALEPCAQPGPQMGAPAGLFSQETSTLLLSSLCSHSTWGLSLLAP